jgi:hypothetical protein
VLPHLPCHPDLATREIFLFADLKRMLAEKKFSTNEEVIAETAAYSGLIQNCTIKMHCIEKFSDRYNRYIALQKKIEYLIKPNFTKKMSFAILAYEIFTPTVIT